MRKKFLIYCFICMVCLYLSGCAAVKPYESPRKKPSATYTGLASYYANKFHGRKTASGEVFDKNKYTAAHKTLPFGTELRVINLENNKSVDVRVNDRGPFVKGRIIDLSPAAAGKIDLMQAGVVAVRIEVL